MFNLGKPCPSITDMIRLDHTHAMPSGRRLTNRKRPRIRPYATRAYAKRAPVPPKATLRPSLPENTCHT